VATNGIQKLVTEQTSAIEVELGKTRLRPKDRIILESIKLVLIILSDDHPRTSSMWQWFRPMVFLTVTACAAIITALVAGYIHISH